MICATRQQASLARSAIPLWMDGENDLRERIEKAGFSLRGFARELDMDPAVLSRTLTGKREWRRDEWDRASVLLEDGRAFTPAPPPAALRPANDRARNVPVYGVAIPRKPGQVAANPAIDDVAVPADLDPRGLFAVRAPDDVMAPRLDAGEILVVRRGVPPARGRDCVIELKDGGLMLGVYMGAKDGRIHVLRYQPEERIEGLAADAVAALHAGVWRRGPKD